MCKERNYHLTKEVLTQLVQYIATCKGRAVEVYKPDIERLVGGLEGLDAAYAAEEPSKTTVVTSDDSNPFIASTDKSDDSKKDSSTSKDGDIIPIEFHTDFIKSGYGVYLKVEVTTTSDEGDTIKTSYCDDAFYTCKGENTIVYVKVGAGEIVLPITYKNVFTKIMNLTGLKVSFKGKGSGSKSSTTTVVDDSSKKDESWFSYSTILIITLVVAGILLLILVSVALLQKSK